MTKSQKISDTGMAGKIEANKYRTQADGNKDLKAREDNEVLQHMAQAVNAAPFQDFNHGNVM